mmetsp:Transcript_37821/g.79207  ORF Transcript_37821/g.79207 Transcript_37821/m.79207 type:complete len:215 (+) Transcript_37821:1057-1701(+)
MSTSRLYLQRSHLRERSIHEGETNRGQEEGGDRAHANHVAIDEMFVAGEIGEGAGADEGMPLRSRWIFYRQGERKSYFNPRAAIQKQGHHRRRFQDGVRIRLHHQFDAGTKVQSLPLYQTRTVVSEAQHTGRRRAHLRGDEGHGGGERHGIRPERGVRAGGDGRAGAEFGGADATEHYHAATRVEVHWDEDAGEERPDVREERFWSDEEDESGG